MAWVIRLRGAWVTTCRVYDLSSEIGVLAECGHICSQIIECGRGFGSGSGLGSGLATWQWRRRVTLFAIVAK